MTSKENRLMEEQNCNVRQETDSISDAPSPEGWSKRELSSRSWRDRDAGATTKQTSRASSFRSLSARSNHNDWRDKRPSRSHRSGRNINPFFGNDHGPGKKKPTKADDRDCGQFLPSRKKINRRGKDEHTVPDTDDRRGKAEHIVPDTGGRRGKAEHIVPDTGEGRGKDEHTVPDAGDRRGKAEHIVPETDAATADHLSGKQKAPQAVHRDKTSWGRTYGSSNRYQYKRHGSALSLPDMDKAGSKAHDRNTDKQTSTHDHGKDDRTKQIEGKLHRSELDLTDIHTPVEARANTKAVRETTAIEKGLCETSQATPDAECNDLQRSKWKGQENASAKNIAGGARPKTKTGKGFYQTGPDKILRASNFSAKHVEEPVRENMTSSINRQQTNQSRAHSAQQSRKLRSHSNEAKADERNEVKEPPQQTKLFFRIQQTFDDVQLALSFLKTKIGPDEMLFDENDFAPIGSSTYISASCPSKKATAMQKMFYREKAKPRVDCHFYVFKEHKLYMENKTIVENKLKKFEHIEKQHLQVHENLISKSEKQIKEEKKKKCQLHTIEIHEKNIKTYEEKLEEYRQQKGEFVKAVEELRSQFSSAKGKRDISKQLEDITNRFHRECRRLKQALPMYAKRSCIVQLVEKNQVCIIKGETGSGKSTQLVQYLMESGTGGRGMIVCTQPRRVAAMTLAFHVAEEMGTQVGGLVGYKVGSKLKSSKHTRILFTTDHSMLNEILSDPDLPQFSCIVVDEAHERSLYTDLLLSMIKRCLPRRPDLRVIISSATIDPQLFQAFFSNCPVLEVSGRLFPVEVKWEKEENEVSAEQDYCESAVAKVIEIHAGLRELPGHILVFVTSPAETEKCCRMVESRMNRRGDFECFQLHGKQQTEDQQKVFKPVKERKRKIVFATNCAETSITIEGIRYVVDTGLAKEKIYDPRRNLSSLRLSTISQSSAIQRMGRAGRTGPGKCFRLFSPNTYENMNKTLPPEILRTHLGQALLKLAELGVDPDDCEFVESPSKESIQDAREMLIILGALDDGKITDKGRWIASLPFDPRLGLMTYIGREKGILYDSVVLAAIMSAEGGMFYRGSSEEEQRVHDITKTKLSLEKGDSLTGLAVYKTWQSLKEQDKYEWCMTNSLNAKALRSVQETVKEVYHILKDKFDGQEQHSKIWQFSSGDVTEDLRKIIFKCYASNLCHRLSQKAGYFAARANRRVQIHPSSCLHMLASPDEWVVFEQLVQTSQDFISGITPVDDSWVNKLCEDNLGFNVAEARCKVLKKIYTRNVGSCAFWDVVGPSYTKLRVLEEKFCSDPRSVVMIEASRKTGEISIFAIEETENSRELTENVDTIISMAETKLQLQDFEVVIAGSEEEPVQEGDLYSTVRVVLGHGGQILDILMMNQTRKVFVTKMGYAKDDRQTTQESKTVKFLESPQKSEDEKKAESILESETKLSEKADDHSSKDSVDSTTSEEMLEKFSIYGTISFIKDFGLSQKGFWGFIIFRTSAEAENAVHETRFKKYHRACLEHGNKKQASGTSPFIDFHLDVKWYLTPRMTYAELEVRPDYLEQCLRLEEFLVDGIMLHVSADRRKKNCLHISGLEELPDLESEDLEKHIKKAFLQALRDQVDEDLNHYYDSNDDENDEAEQRNYDIERDKITRKGKKICCHIKRDIMKEYTDLESDRSIQEVQRPWEYVNLYDDDRRQGVSDDEDKQGHRVRGKWSSTNDKKSIEEKRKIKDIDIIRNVRIPRRKNPLCRTQQSLTEQMIRDIFGRYDDSVREIKLNADKDKFLCATVKYKNAEEGFRSYYEIQRKRICFDLNFFHNRLEGVEIVPRSTSNMFVNKDQWTKVPGIEELVKDLREEGIAVIAEDIKTKSGKKQPKVTPEKSSRNEEQKENQQLRLVVEARTPELVKDGVSRINSIMRGETMDCSQHMMVYTQSGRAMLQQLEKETNTVVQTHKMSKTLVIRGRPQARAEMKEKIEAALQSLLPSREFSLKGECLPPGLMKALVQIYGEDLLKLVADTGLHSASLDFRRQKVKVTGDDESLERAAREIQKLTDDAWENCSRTPPTNSELCSACLCPPEGEMYRLELCGHAYCRVCFEQQVHLAVRERALPVLCCHAGCERPLALRDFRNLARDDRLQMLDLARAALQVFLRESGGTYHPCPTPECPAVYRADVPRARGTNTTSYNRRADTLFGPDDSLFSVFVCPSCHVATCTHCHSPGHEGRPCLRPSKNPAVHDEQGASGVMAWAAQDPSNRKPCPSCGCLIEKNKGCDHMVCVKCKSIICWLCLKVFKTDRECIGHLMRTHNDRHFVPGYI